MGHTCHVRSCRAACPPKHLTCLRCWKDVPDDIQREVYATVKKRNMKDGGTPDETWGPWWRAQAKAIHAVYVAGVKSGRWTEATPGAFDADLQDAHAFADYLEKKITGAELREKRGY